MAYLYSTNTTAQSVGYVYRCSRCGNLIAQNVFVEGNEAKFDRYNRASYANAQQQSEISSQLVTREAIDAANQGDYSKLRIANCCPVCKNREPWQQCATSSQTSRRLIPLNLLMGFALFFFAVTFGNEETRKLSIIALIVALCLLAVDLYFFFRNRKMRELTATVPEASRPHIFLNDEQFDNACAQLGLRSDEEIRYDYKKWYRDSGD